MQESTRTRTQKLRAEVRAAAKPETIKKICELIARGHPFDGACTASCVPYWTGRLLLDDKESEFALQVSAAMNAFETKLLQVMTAHGTKQWQPLAWLLENYYPEKYGKQKSRLEVDELKARIALLEAKRKTLEAASDDTNKTLRLILPALTADE